MAALMPPASTAIVAAAPINARTLVTLLSPPETRSCECTTAAAGDRSGGAVDQGLPEARRRKRHVQMRHAEWRERVHHRVDHGGRDADAAGLADALGAERIAWRGRARFLDDHGRHLVSTRDRV